WTGTVTLDEVGPELVEGSLDLANAEGEAFVGPFSAPLCPSAQKSQGDACTGEGIGSGCR
ncbi:MAG TPA: hypothetical protein VFZ53_10375, partial [Polyangiaceae bacterium]